MNKGSAQIVNIFFLSVAYFILLIMFVIPHHHHDEISCFVSSHCEEGHGEDENEEPGDHHHDHSTPDKAEYCISRELYVSSNANNKFRQIVDLLSMDDGHQIYKDALFRDVLKETERASNLRSREFIFTRNTFIESIKLDLPLRAPPPDIS